MARKFVLLLVKDINGGLPHKIIYLQNAINSIGGHFDYPPTVITSCDKNDIKVFLHFLIKNGNNVIIVIGDNTVYPTHKVASEAIQEVMETDISKKLHRLLSILENDLKERTFQSVICGVRRQALMMNLCGSAISGMSILRKNHETIFNIIRLITESELTSTDNNDTDNNDIDNNDIDNNDIDNNHIDNNDIDNNDIDNNDIDNNDIDNNDIDNNDIDNNDIDNNDIDNNDIDNNDIDNNDIDNNDIDNNDIDNNDIDNNDIDNNDTDNKGDTNDNSGNASLSEERKKIAATIEMYKKRQQSIIMDSAKFAIDMIDTVICKSAKKIRTEVVKSEHAHGRILAADVFSSINVPFYKSSAKHGYAILASDGQGVRRVLAARPTSADNETSVVSGTCMRVRSGASIPNGATAVVTLDNTRIIETDDEDNHNDYFNSDDKEYQINVLIAPTKDENIRNAGYVIQDDHPVLDKYSRIGPEEIGILTLCGIPNVLVVIQVTSVGLLSIGDELENPGTPLGSERIYDSNRRTLTSLLKENGLNSVDFGISAYELHAIIRKMRNALERVDVLVTMGRANDNDMLKPILQGYFNATIHFGRVNMKPGKSTTFATCSVNKKKKYILCMSANPVTVPIVAHLLLLPFLNKLNHNFLANPIVLKTYLRMEHELHPRSKFMWATLEWNKKTGTLYSRLSEYGQTQMLKYSGANVLVMLPARTLGMPRLPAGYITTILIGSQTLPRHYRQSARQAFAYNIRDIACFNYLS